MATSSFDFAKDASAARMMPPSDWKTSRIAAVTGDDGTLAPAISFTSTSWTPIPDTTKPHDSVDLDSAANRAIARELADRSVVLLANEGALPLRAPTTISLVGPGAADAGVFMGCYSYPIHVGPRHPELGFGVAAPDLRDSLAREFPHAQVRHARVAP